MGLLTFRKDDSGFCVENTLKGNKDGKKDRSLEASAIILQRRKGDGGCSTEDGRVEVPQRHLLWKQRGRVPPQLRNQESGKGGRGNGGVDYPGEELELLAGL